jgi:6,7-dimethyl-8-ribityllumazine synthase
LARKVADTDKFDSIIYLDTMIRGTTPHFDLVVRETASGVNALTAEGKIAIAFGVLACENIEQTVERARAKAGNRGADAAMVAVEMADLYARMAAEKAAEPTVSVVPPPANTTDLPRRK